MKIKNYKIFTLAINEENNQCQVVLSNNLIDTLESEDKAKNKIDKKPWDYIFKLIIIVVNNVINQKEKEQKNENKN